MKTKSVVAITMGDPGGIGPEIILKTLAKQALRKASFFLLIGSRSVFEFASKRLKIPFRLHPIPVFDRSLFRHDVVNFLDITEEARAICGVARQFEQKNPRGFEIGKVSVLNGSLAYAAVKMSAHLGSHGLIQALVTAPVNKEAIRLLDPHFVGHTEYLARVDHVRDFAMLFYSKFFCVTLVTIHVPLKEVAWRIKRGDIEAKIRLTHEFLKRSLRIPRPRIVVSALNPHGREFGREEERIILPAAQKMRRLGIDVVGPLPGDEVFRKAYQRRFDAVVSMYHDQGLGPFKMLAFDEGVNVTLGLPYLRTSPDHGTAFDIAYQNKANPNSFQKALFLVLKSS